MSAGDLAPRALEGFDPMGLDDAKALLASALPGPPEDIAEIATMLDCAPAVLTWAAGLARTLGWGPLRARIAIWSSFAKAPWHEDVGRVVGTLARYDATLLSTLAACDAPFAWDVLEAVVPDASIDAICRLEEAHVLRRSAQAGVVAFVVPYAVRAFHRAKSDLATVAEQWLDAWVARAEQLRGASYGATSRATLAELGAALPLAARALLDERTARKGLALWIASSDAAFFGAPIPFDAPAFTRAVEVADGVGTVEPRVRTRLMAGRAMLECGKPEGAAVRMAEAKSLADDEGLVVDALRGMGWASLALTKFDDARKAFDEARALAEGEPRGQADATAGLGILALVSGNPEAAQLLLAEALAIHVVMRDTPREAAVRAMMELLPSRGAIDTRELTAQVVELRGRGQRWREAIALARLALDARGRNDEETARARLLEARAAASLSGMPAAALARSLVEETGSPRTPLVVAHDGRLLTLPKGETLDLTRHGPVRRVLWALAVHRRDKPGMAMSTFDLIDAGWPGEKMRHEAARLRVYTTIRRLRAFGLGDLLVTQNDGYLLDPEQSIRIE